MLGQSIDHGAEMERRLADPACQRGAIQIDAGPGENLGLAIQRAVIGVFRDQHMGDRAFGRQGTFDQMRRRGRLGDAIGAGPAGVFRAHRDDDPQLRRHDIEPLGAVLADPVHPAADAGAERAFRLDHLLDPGQVLRQVADVPIDGPALPARRWRRRRAFRGLLLDLRHRATSRSSKESWRSSSVSRSDFLP